MRVPFVLFLMSCVAALVGFGLTGAIDSAPVLLALLSALAALILLVRHRPSGPPPRWIVVDGSNVMHWQGGAPDLATVSAVLGDLARRGFVPVVGFDANVGYLVGGRYMGPHRLARVLGVPEAQVFVAPKGTPADPLLLQRATALRAPVVTNDRYRDWVDAHPQVGQPGFLIRGVAQAGAVSLQMA